jgi:hypothetical protein
MDASSEDKKTVAEISSKEIKVVKPTPNNSDINFIKKVLPSRKGQPGEPLPEQAGAFCCKALLPSRMFAICLFRALSNC